MKREKRGKNRLLGEFVGAVAAQRWLSEAHGIERAYQTVWGWLKKSWRSAVGAAPQSLQKDPCGGRSVPRYWEEFGSVLRLIGREWIRSQVNASH